MLRDLLQAYRAEARSEREKGDYFERLVRIYLTHDAIQRQFLSDVRPFPEWAKAQGWTGNDTGVDLVATLADGSGLAAIQCKFQAEDHVIQKPDLDSFISAASNDRFTRLIIVDTTRKGFGPNARRTLDRLSKDWNRISLADLEASPIDWSRFLRTGDVSLAPAKELRDHQREALEAVVGKLAHADRGKLIMACGTGKTFTALRIAETMAGAGGRVLCMVPSLALMSQTVREWSNDASLDLAAFSACSDVKVGRRVNADSLGINRHDLAFPATTDPARLAEAVHAASDDRMTVVFSTYHSIDVLSRAQKDHGLPEFDLAICDEAHRTTGVTLKGDDESAFVRIHSDDHVSARKRLYMTATPRIFGDAAKRKADDHDAELASMDDVSKFGKDLFHRGFGWAVENGLLTDYKVVVLEVDEALVAATTQNRLRDGPELTLDDATKIVGCYKALNTRDSSDVAHPMKRALAFCQSIAKSRIIEDEFSAVVGDYLNSELVEDKRHLACEVRHVDGGFNATEREEMLDWLKAEAEVCRILTNARVLSEGVDVPSLDAIMFMHPRKSQIDVVQAVGRVMRTAEGKKLGYVILPVAIPPNTKPEDALNENERYRVVWQILNALRAHDERLDARINQASLGEDISDKVQLVHMSSETELKAVTAVVDGFSTSRTKAEATGAGIGSDLRPPPPAMRPPVQQTFAFDEFTRAIMARIVEKCGTRDYWDSWAKDIAKIAQTHITRITAITETPGPEREAFLAFLGELRDDLNPAVTEAEAIEMLAQHLITRPVFDALFRDNEFTARNPVSRAMETVLGQLHEHNLAKESESLERFYASVQRRAEGVKTAKGRQALISELYDRFFRNAFPLLTQRMGIVYTPVEVVDFIIHSVNDVLKEQFGQTLGSSGVHILDPFTGTGTFITRLLQSGLIAPDELEHKYCHEIHANEIVLLAYYIAAVNIETVYRELAQGDLACDAPYHPFKGILLTDTFQMYEQERDMVANLLPDNSERRTRQKGTEIRVIVGNPPYSTGQKNENDNARNVEYPRLDAAIRDSYARHSQATNKNALYDSYIRAFRWASDRIGEAGAMAFVSGSAWIERAFADGMRKCLAEEFSDLHLFHLRGDIRKNMLSKGAAREGQNVFGSASMTGISIAVLVKNPKATGRGRIHFHDIGPDLTSGQKLGVIQELRSINGITSADGWRHIVPDESHDWLDQVDRSFLRFPVLGAKSGAEDGLFANYSVGVKTNRDAWAYNSSRAKLAANIGRMMEFYNSEVDRWEAYGLPTDVNEFVNNDERRISWTGNLKAGLAQSKRLAFELGAIREAIYRPFQPQWQYFDRRFNERVYQMPRIFPEAGAENLAIHVSGVGARAGFSALMVDRLPDLHHLDSGQCFPLWLYETTESQDGLFGVVEGQGTTLTRSDAITDSGLTHF
ncbi:MAG: DEAD/DEAH box helicase family protein, partial [Boseongicola sp.]|nr:DEAD/DEAH box helicase family protein [Boseongicola sp.]